MRHDKLRPWSQIMPAALLALLFPGRCPVCRKPEPRGILCAQCQKQLRYLPAGVCRCCGAVLPGQLSDAFCCGACRSRTPPFTLARSLLIYREPVSTLLHRLKYQADTSVLPALAALITAGDLPGWADLFADCQAVIPVPLHHRRLQQRGLNQSLLLARLFFPTDHPPIVTDLLERSRYTKPQTGLDGINRRRNLQGAFQLRPDATVTGLRVVLVDDVFTTGSTLMECSRVLQAAGASAVSCLTLARAG